MEHGTSFYRLPRAIPPHISNQQYVKEKRVCPPPPAPLVALTWGEESQPDYHNILVHVCVCVVYIV